MEGGGCTSSSIRGINTRLVQPRDRAEILVPGTQCDDGEEGEHQA